MSDNNFDMRQLKKLKKVFTTFTVLVDRNYFEKNPRC